MGKNWSFCYFWIRSFWAKNGSKWPDFRRSIFGGSDRRMGLRRDFLAKMVKFWSFLERLKNGVKMTIFLRVLVKKSRRRPFGGIGTSGKSADYRSICRQNRPKSDDFDRNRQGWFWAKFGLFGVFGQIRLNFGERRSFSEDCLAA